MKLPTRIDPGVPSPGQSPRGESSSRLEPVDSRAVFLIGAARSGTSLLYKTLCLHPEAAYISNWVRRVPRAPALASLNRLARRAPELQLRAWFGAEASNAYVYGTRRRLTERLVPMPVEGEPVFARCGLGDGSVAPRPGAASALRKTVDAIRHFGGGRVFVSKRIANNRRIQALLEAFPDARFVDITRDGRAVAYSLSRVDWWDDSTVWWYGGTPRRWREEGGDPWELCARNWVEELHEIDAGIGAVPRASVLSLTYEDLVRSPEPTLEKVAAFVGLTPDPVWTERISSLRFPDRNETWRTKLDRTAVDVIERVQRAELTRRGYE